MLVRTFIILKKYSEITLILFCSILYCTFPIPFGNFQCSNEEKRYLLFRASYYSME